VVWFILFAIFWRCPYCNKKLPGLPSKDVEVCKHCGRDLTEED
jgi:DNA-directed RNA polymerase subunit RPC12/RpoP